MCLDDRTVRSETVCRGCGGEKGVGCVVCWTCFKYRTDVTPFKYFDGGLNDWLAYVRNETGVCTVGYPELQPE